MAAMVAKRANPVPVAMAAQWDLIIAMKGRRPVFFSNRRDVGVIFCGIAF